MADRARGVRLRSGDRGWGWAGRFLLALLAWSSVAGPSGARTLEEALISTFPGQLSEDARGLATVFSRSVAASFPITGASAAYVYRFDPATDSFQRLNVPLGPVFSERADPVGSHKLSLAVNYALVQYDSIDGRDLHTLESNDPRTSATHIAICAGPTLCEPVLAKVRLDLEAQIVTFSATYGITQNLDVNLLVPVVRTFLRSSATFTGPDPRLPPSGTPLAFHFAATASEASTGVGDLLFRLKYQFERAAVADLGAGFILSVPSGDRADFHGTGDTLTGVALYASHTYRERIEPHVNAAFVLDADKFDRSSARYSAGADVRLLDWLTLNADFLGRSDVARPDSIDGPVFVQIERADVLQFSTGLKAALPARIAVFFNALLPLNMEGLRSDRVLVFGIERTF